MKTTRIITTLAFAAIAIINNNANAQSTSVQLVQPQVNQGSGQVIGNSIETRVVQQPVIAPQAPAPKLGLTGQIVYGLGMKVLTVNYGSPAQRAGLEYGDIIMKANGIRITCQADLIQALSNAAAYSNGVVNLYVKNVRGCPIRGDQYVNVTAHLFGQAIPVAGVSTSPVVHN